MNLNANPHLINNKLSDFLTAIFFWNTYFYTDTFSDVSQV